MRVAHLVTAGGVLLLAVGAAGAAFGQDDPAVSASAELWLVSRYVWRGYDLSRGRPALQPYVEVAGPAGLGFNVFTTSALDRTIELDEWQFGATLSREAGEWSFGAGALVYHMPGTETEPTGSSDPFAPVTTGELFASVGRSAGPAAATLTWSQGLGQARGASANLLVQVEMSAGPWTLAPDLQVDYLAQYGAPASLRERIASVAFTAPVSRRVGPVTLTASGTLAWIPSRYVRAANESSGAGGAALVPWVALVVRRGG